MSVRGFGSGVFILIPGAFVCRDASCPGVHCTRYHAKGKLRAGIQACTMVLGHLNPIFSHFHKNHSQLCIHLEGHLFLFLQRGMWARGGSYHIPRTGLSTLPCQLALGVFVNVSWQTTAVGSQNNPHSSLFQATNSRWL